MSFLSRLLRACLALALAWAGPALAAQHAPDPEARPAAPPGLMSLASGWRYRAGDDPAFADPAFQDAEWAALPDLTDRRAAFPAGRGWYRLRVPVPPGQALGLALGRIHAPLEVYANGQQVGERGVLGPSRIPHTPELTFVEIPPTDGTLLLALRGELDPGLMALARDPVPGRRVWLGPRDLVEARAAQANAEWRASIWGRELERWGMCLFFTLLGLFHL